MGGHRTASTNAILGGWQLSTIFRYSSGIPFFFRSSYCNVPGQFRAACIPSTSGRHLRAGASASLDVTKPIFNQSAFTSPDAFNFYYGNGPRISDFRKSGYRNQDLSLIKNTRLYRDVNLQLRIEAFNVWNWHNWNSSGSTQWGGNRLQHRRRERGLRHVERERDRPARHPARGAPGVLAHRIRSRRPLSVMTPGRPKTCLRLRTGLALSGASRWIPERQP